MREAQFNRILGFWVNVSETQNICASPLFENDEHVICHNAVTLNMIVPLTCGVEMQLR